MLCVDFGYFTRILSPIWSLSFFEVVESEKLLDGCAVAFCDFIQAFAASHGMGLGGGIFGVLVFLFLRCCRFRVIFFAVAAADSCFAFELRNVSATFAVVVVSACSDAFSGVTVPLMLSVDAIFPTIAVVSWLLLFHCFLPRCRMQAFRGSSPAGCRLRAGLSHRGGTRVLWSLP